MKKLFSVCFTSIAMTLLAMTGYGQTIITEAKDTITPTKQTLSKTIKVGTLAYKDSVIKYDTVILVVKKYVPPVTPGNILPTADAGPDKEITSPLNTVYLVGDGGDVDGLFTVQWSIVSGVGVIVNGTTLVNASVQQLTPGTTVVRLTVTDDKGAKATDDMVITVLPAVDPGVVKNYPLSFTPIPVSDPDVNAPGRGAEQWHDRTDVKIPSEAAPQQPLDVYYRFVWTRIEDITQGSYNWTYFDNLVKAAIAKRQKFSFGIMTVYPEGTANEGLHSYGDGSYSAYPKYLHDLMQAESVKDWKTGPTWTPNYNSANYLNRLLALNQAINAHIQTTSFNGIQFKNVVNCIDIRGYGAWGEWHSGYTPNNVVSDYPAGTFPTIASLKKIVDAFTTGFPDNPLVAMIAAFDGMRLGNTKNPVEIGYYILTGKNNWGPIGWRRDQYGATDDYIQWYLEKNPNTFNGVALSTLIMDRWKTSYITGEPPAWNPNEYADLERQVRLYHTTSFGNGNYGGGTAPSSLTTRDRIRAASKATGYRLQYKTANISTNGNGIGITINWENIGLGPTYENWDIIYELIDAAGVAKYSYVSSFKLRWFLPGANGALTDAFTALGATGPYKVNVKVVDPTGYRSPLILAMPGRNADGSYTLKAALTF
jgi:hypothetical protein